MVTRTVVVIGILSSALVVAGERAAEAEPCDRVVKVMTQNMDTGTDYGLILGATGTADLLAGVAATYAEVVASNMPERAARLAAVIGEEMPDLVMLEEVTTVRTGPFMQPPATTVVYDQLQLLLDALAARRLPYAAVGVRQEADFELPSGAGIDVRTTDHDVLLVRTDLPHSEFAISDVETHGFVNVVTLSSPTIGNLTVPRGWISANMRVCRNSYRVAGTHLEDFASSVQVAQAGELIAALADVTSPVILLGDFNANAEPGPEHYATVGDLLAAGFEDDWSAVHPREPGYTWPLFLEDPVRPATPDERIDLIFSRGDVRVRSIERTGMAHHGRPSDHAGVVAELVTWHRWR